MNKSNIMTKKDFELGLYTYVSNILYVDEIVLFDTPQGKAKLEEILKKAPENATKWRFGGDDFEPTRYGYGTGAQEFVTIEFYGLRN